MTIFVDASALVAIIRNEPEASTLIDALERHATRLTSGPAMWESVRAIARASERPIDEAWSLCEMYRKRLKLTVVPFGIEETSESIRAHARFGKGVHRARLNMGDCFSYACAKTNDASLLYVGDDFSRTDLA